MIKKYLEKLRTARNQKMEIPQEYPFVMFEEEKELLKKHLLQTKNYLEFGTGGLRGIMGVGTNRMNRYTVGMATQGYANYLQQSFPDEQVRVAIAHDSRYNSRYFAETAANVFAANGIKVFYVGACIAVR